MPRDHILIAYLCFFAVCILWYLF